MEYVTRPDKWTGCFWGAAMKLKWRNRRELIYFLVDAEWAFVDYLLPGIFRCIFYLDVSCVCCEIEKCQGPNWMDGVTCWFGGKCCLGGLVQDELLVWNGFKEKMGFSTLAIDTGEWASRGRPRGKATPLFKRREKGRFISISRSQIRSEHSATHLGKWWLLYVRVTCQRQWVWSDIDNKLVRKTHFYSSKWTWTVSIVSIKIPQMIVLLWKDRVRKWTNRITPKIPCNELISWGTYLLNFNYLYETVFEISW